MALGACDNPLARSDIVWRDGKVAPVFAKGAALAELGPGGFGYGMWQPQRAARGLIGNRVRSVLVLLSVVLSVQKLVAVCLLGVDARAKRCQITMLVMSNCCCLLLSIVPVGIVTSLVVLVSWTCQTPGFRQVSILICLIRSDL